MLKNADKESSQLSEFRVAMQDLPQRVQAAIDKGVETSDTPATDMPCATAKDLLREPLLAKTDKVLRNSDGVLVVCCHTDMPNVTPDMWDWWFGWHMPSTERYKLWHPRDHVRSRVAFNENMAAKHGSAYIGQVSMVDEYIGGKLQKLSIAFDTPAAFGLDQAETDKQGVAICARTGLRGKAVEAGILIHLVRKTPQGSEMLSRFWLGEASFKVPIVGPLITAAMNTKTARKMMLPDHMGLALLQHCSEEMNHLASILPELFEKFAASN